MIVPHPQTRPLDDPPRPLRVLLAVNSTAGSWRRGSVAALATAFQAAGATVVAGSDADARLAAADDIDHVCIVGGDGSVRHVAAAIHRLGRSPSISVYPLGTVNLLARESGYPLDPARFVARVIAGEAARAHHIALIGDTPMLVCASVGPDSCTIDRLSLRHKRVIGRAAYVVAFVRVLIDWPRYDLRVVSGERDVRCGAVYIAKGRYFAGPWSFAPEAMVDEPLLHVVALECASRLAILRFAWALLRDRLPRNAIRFTCAELTIDGYPRAPVQADGDVVARLPVRIAISPETLTFL